MSIGKVRRAGLPFGPVAANSTATMKVSPGRTIEEIALVLGGTTFNKSHITGLRMRANAHPIVDVSGDQLNAINAYRGTTQTATHLPIPFADYQMQDELSEQVGAFDTSIGIEDVTIELDIGAATAPTLRSLLTESAQQRDNSTGQYKPWAGMMSKILRYPFNVSAGGQLLIPVPTGTVNGAIIKRAHIFSSLATAVTVKQDGTIVFEHQLADANEYYTRCGRVPQSNVFHVDFAPQGNIGDALDTRNARSIEWAVTFSGAASGWMVVEYIDPLANL